MFNFIRAKELRESTTLVDGSSMTQQALADMMNVSRQTISNWENGKKSPSKKDAGVLADRLGVSATELYMDDEEVLKVYLNARLDYQSSETRSEEAIQRAVADIETRFSGRLLEFLDSVGKVGMEPESALNKALNALFASDDISGDKVNKAILAFINHNWTIAHNHFDLE